MLVTARTRELEVALLAVGRGSKHSQGLDHRQLLKAPEGELSRPFGTAASRCGGRPSSQVGMPPSGPNVSHESGSTSKVIALARPCGACGA